jgi:hypothetical protein
MVIAIYSVVTSQRARADCGGNFAGTSGDLRKRCGRQQRDCGNRKKYPNNYSSAE